MDTRDTPEQAELRRTARQLARELGPRTSADLDDGKRARRLAEAVRDAGWLELREQADDGGPLASGVEAALIADALGESVADVAFSGPVLAADLARRAGVRPVESAVVAFGPDLCDAAMVTGRATTTALYAVDTAAEGPVPAYVLAPAGDGYRLALVRVEGLRDGADLTRAIRAIPAGVTLTEVPGASRPLTRADLDAWSALGLALTSADLVGIMRGVLDVSVAYAQQRKQYGVAIGTFQAVQHLLAEARCLMEGAWSAALYPAW
ncbi:MAG TPA: acyl-CoA dehydrogenase family protein, partial [Myxococcota bacterium]|nr:acyl-CoA dehydrogenase family protein [Myxococcota bacterium]